jgi:demethylmenaquinone methyltransferase/2-methoxy-6-polyprenyl-1,4-benzoquinol methylase
MSLKVDTGHPLQKYYSRIYETYDRVNRLFTFGLDRRWRAKTVEACLRDNPQTVLDLCCGTGDLAIGVAGAGHTELTVTAFDLNASMLETARRKAVLQDVQKISFLQGDAGKMPFTDDEFDRITIGFGFRNLTWENPERERYLKEISRVLKPDGKLLILESAVPKNWFFRFGYRLYLHLILIPLGGWVSGDWKAYRYLAGSSSSFYDFETLRQMLNDYGLALYLEKSFLAGSVNLLIAIKKTV